MAQGERLLLFDIDGTLVDTGGAGMSALRDAIREVFEADGPELDLAGATDSGLLKNIYLALDREEDEQLSALFFDRYLARLEVNLQDQCFGGRALEGVLAILSELEDAQVAKGLLTGNISGGADLKMRHYGMDHHFSFGAYGDDHHDRNLLGPIALERASQATGRRFTGAETIVIGDTPKDIWCAQAFGARSVAVATGSFSVDELKAEGADLVFEDFSEVEDVLKTLLAERSDSVPSNPK
jgi:phosphoglycolate phosphatase-like HAD superfamily hydrolase